MKHEQEPDVELRDVFAMQAMRVVRDPLTRMERSANEKTLTQCKSEFAAECYEIADYLMRARKK